jgi:hypothetical protein
VIEGSQTSNIDLGEVDASLSREFYQDSRGIEGFLMDFVGRLAQLKLIFRKLPIVPDLYW